MISYAPLWATMKKKNITTYDFIHNYGISSNTIYRIKKENAITTRTIDDLCKILECKVSDIIEFVDSGN